MSGQIANWAILVYISADHELANFAVESLKQLKRGADGKTIALVEAHSGNLAETCRYVFDGVRGLDAPEGRDSSIRSNLEPQTSPLPSGGIADPLNLTRFIEWASQYEAKHRCLFLWGHGYELLLNEDETAGAKESGRNYLAPKSLKEALQTAKQRNPKLNFDIIGIDACGLSLFELASELSGCGDFLVASQEDVPDQSFPYEQMLLKMRTEDKAETVAADIPELYRQFYQDYVLGPEAGTNEITLASVRLKSTGSVQEPLKLLSKALLSSVSDPALRKAILSARKGTREFALGMFVDLRDFCVQLTGQVADGELKSACDAVRNAIDASGEDACILTNRAGKGSEPTHCHGLSIYLPYLSKEEREDVQRMFVEGGTDLVAQLPLLIKGGTNHLLKARGVRISEIEQDFEALTAFKETGWSDFIKRGWSFLLASEEPGELDEHYSGQQCAINLVSFCEPPEPPLASRQATAGS
jgi:Clostripain family